MTIRATLAATMIACLVSGSAAAQQPTPRQVEQRVTSPTQAQPVQSPRPAQAPQPPRPAQPAQPPQPPQPPRPARVAVEPVNPPAPPQLSNVRFEVVITETGATPAKKTVSMIVADWGRGSVRSLGVTDGVPGPNPKGGGEINVDARPRIERNGLIRATIVVEYRNKVNVQFDSLLESGKAVVVSEAPDPGSESMVTVAVTATTLK